MVFGGSIFVLLKHNKFVPAELRKAEQEVYSILLFPKASNYNSEYVYNIDIDELQILEYTNFDGDPVEAKSDVVTSNRHIFLGLPPNFRGCQVSAANSAGYFIDFDMDKYSGLQKETWADLQEKNQIAYPLEEYLPSTDGLTFINPSTGKQGDSWVSFSRIGFNWSLTQALVQVVDCRGDLCYDSAGSFMYCRGYYVFLHKIDGKWMFENMEEAWLIEAPSP